MTTPMPSPTPPQVGVRPRYGVVVLTMGKRPKELEHAVRDLVDESIESAGVVDIFKAAGIEQADLSILDDQFLQTFKQILENPLYLFLG